MRHIIFSRYGAPDVLVARDAPTPSPAAGEVRIAVRAAGVNFADVLARWVCIPTRQSRRWSSGTRWPARIDAVGTASHGSPPGDRVVALTRFGGYASEIGRQRRLCVSVPSPS